MVVFFVDSIFPVEVLRPVNFVNITHVKSS